MLLGAVHESVQCILQRPEPEALINQISPLHLQLTFAAQNIRSQRQALQFLVSLDQQEQPRCFVDLAGFDPHHPVLDHVEPTDAVAARQAVGFADHRHRIQALAIDGDGIASFEGNLDLLRCIRRLRHR